MDYSLIKQRGHEYASDFILCHVQLQGLSFERQLCITQISRVEDRVTPTQIQLKKAQV